MPDLTEQQRRFVLAYASGEGAIGNAAEAARRAGYSEKSAAEIGRQLLEKPHVKKAVDEAFKRQIGGGLAARAVGVLARILDDEAAPLKVRLDAAKTVLDRAGHGARPALADAPEADPLDGLSVAELQAMLDGLKRRPAGVH
ncbi:MAG: terminase small subunit [Geminicoccaceae bacterium]|nr:terminase small subunit [Geminicoccaceae bacterium]